MKLIKFEKFKLTISEEALLIKAFRTIWERDKSEDKHKALTDFGIMYFMYDPRSDYSCIIDEKERMSTILQHQGLPPDFKIDKKLKEAIEVYKKLTITPASLLLKDMNETIDKLRIHIKELDLSAEDDKGKPKYTINSITAALRDIPKLIKELAEAEKAVISEIEDQSRRRGNKTKTVTEDGIGQFL